MPPHRSARDIRRRNRSDVLRRIYASQETNRQELVIETGLSYATIRNLTGELLSCGVVAETAFDSSGGRPRARLAANRGRGALVGVDIAETYIHFELFDMALQVGGALERPRHAALDNPADPGQLVAQLSRGITALLAEAGADGGDVLGVGISVPGQVDREHGVSVFAPNWGWHDVPLRDLLAARLDLPPSVPLHLDNPLRASTVAELWFGAGRGVDELVVVTVGTGVGAGVAIGGALVRGTTNSAGEWGHTTLVFDGRPCRCGNRGCVEAYVGAPGIMATLAEIAPASPMLRSADQTATIDALAAAAAAGDPDADRVFDVTASYLGAAVANLVNVFNPRVLVLGGWVCGRFGGELVSRVRRAAERHALHRPLAAVTMLPCEIAGNPVSLGMATLALEGFLDTIGTVDAAAGLPTR